MRPPGSAKMGSGSRGKAWPVNKKIPFFQTSFYGIAQFFLLFKMSLIRPSGIKNFMRAGRE